jgi:hypothetical protein
MGAVYAPIGGVLFPDMTDEGGHIAPRVLE